MKKLTTKKILKLYRYLINIGRYLKTGMIIYYAMCCEDVYGNGIIN